MQAPMTFSFYGDAIINGIGIRGCSDAARTAALAAYADAIKRFAETNVEREYLRHTPDCLQHVAAQHGVSCPEGFTGEEPVYYIGERRGRNGKRPLYVVLAAGGERFYAAGCFFGRNSSFGVNQYAEEWMVTPAQLAAAYAAGRKAAEEVGEC